MKNVTLISDWKLLDPYMAMFKGRILSAIPDAKLIDITHAIERHNLYQTAVLLQGSYSAFAPGTVHLVLTSVENCHQGNPVWLKFDDHYFIGDDNGILSMLVKDEDCECRCYAEEELAPASFLNKMIQLLVWHFEGTLEQHTTSWERRDVISPIPDVVVSEHQICGHIIYIDACCNAITDIPTDLFLNTLNGKPFTAKLPDCLAPLNITQYFRNYQKNDNVYLTSNMLGYLEITLHLSHVAILAGLKIGNEIVIEF